jgi:RNA recognition motif-containing protein
MEASARHRKRASSSSLQHPSRNFGPSLSHNNHILKRNRSSSNLQAIGEILESTVVVKNLASSFTSADELRDFFQNYGDVSHVRLVPEQSYGLVTFDAKEIAHGVIVASNSKEGITMGNSKRKVGLVYDFWTKDRISWFHLYVRVRVMLTYVCLRLSIV